MTNVAAASELLYYRRFLPKGDEFQRVLRILRVGQRNPAADPAEAFRSGTSAASAAATAIAALIRMGAFVGLVDSPIMRRDAIQVPAGSLWRVCARLLLSLKLPLSLGASQS